MQIVSLIYVLTEGRHKNGGFTVGKTLLKR